MTDQARRARDVRSAGVAPASDVQELEDRLIEAGPRLLTYFARRTETLQDAEDLLGEVMAVAWRRRTHLPSESVAIQMWLFGVARNVLATHRRQHWRRSRLRERLESEETTRGKPATDPRVEALREALHLLNQQDRELVTLIHWDGFLILEAAQILGLRPSTARSRYHRLRGRLRKCLDSAPEAP